MAVGCNILAGHVEITYYTLLIMGFYAAARLLVLWRQTPPSDSLPARSEGQQMKIISIVQRGIWLVGMVSLGLALGAVQFIPLFEFAGMNFRSGSASYEEVVGWAHPLRDLLQFALPNFYGNPSHHQYVDVFSREVIAVTVNAFGQPINHTDWGIKNYVEGALYVGIVPLALAVYAVVGAFWRRVGGSRSTPTGHVIIFGILALLGLTFMFGLPTYRLLYLLPGIDQLHSPFRWIYAVTFSVAVLAGLGADHLARAYETRAIPESPLRRGFAYILLALGALTLIGLLLSYIFYAQVEPLAQWMLDNMVTASGEPAAARFADARMFYSYQFTNVLTLGVMLIASGAVFWWADPTPGVVRAIHESPLRNLRFGQIFAVGLVALDLMIASWGFNPASDPALLDFTPPAVEWLQGQPGDWRYTTLDDPTQRPILNANSGWRYGLRDIRGYESIIPRHYVDYMWQIAPQTQLEFNRVAPLYTDYGASGFDYRDALESPLLNLLGVRYVMTHKTTALPEAMTAPRGARTGPAWTLAYEDDAVRVWSNGNNGLVRALRELNDPVQAVWSPALQRDTGREKVIDVRMDEPTWLVISETYMPDWRAFIRPWGADEDAEVALEVQPVYDALQGIHVADVQTLIHQAIEAGTAHQTFYLNAIETAVKAGDAAQVETLISELDALVATNPPEMFGNINGRIADAVAAWRASDNTNLEQRAFESRLLELKQAHWTVRVVYSPASFQIGLFLSFLGAVLVVFMPGVWLWRMFVARDDSAISRVARNSVAPIILNLFNRGIDFAFALVMLRILGPEDAGIYFYAGFIFVWFDIFTNFGLDLFLTREVARNRALAARYFYTTSALRFGLTLIGLIFLAAFLFARQSLIAPPLDSNGVIAIILLYVGLFPGSLSKGMTSLFYAYEQAEYPAAITTLSTISKTLLGLIVLVMGYGVIGLAGASIVTNVLTLAILMWGGRRLLTSHSDSLSVPTERGRQDWASHVINFPLMRTMMGQSWPLLINHFLATIFFQIDVLIIEAVHGARMVGLYSVAYKWLSALNVIPSFFTQAMLPLMSRQAHEDRDALKRTYVLAVKLLLLIALPTAVLFTFLAYLLTEILGGAQYLPDGAIATQLMIWSIPFGWINSLTQYVLVALDLQRRITMAFIIAVSFNVITNLIFIPQYGYQAAALTTIASELLLLLPFAWLLHRALGPLPWLVIILRPALAAGALFAVLAIGWDTQPLIALLVGLLVYVAALWVLRPLTPAEIERLRPLLPGRLRTVGLRAGPG